MTDPRRATPRTDAVLADPRLEQATHCLGHDIVKTAVRRAQQQCRDGLISPEYVADTAYAALPAAATSMRPVINATGIVVHTNLGRAPLSDAARLAVGVASGTTDVELNLATGRRGRRGSGAIDALADAVPEAGGVHVVNNGAAALALAACALAQGREIIVARGELVEIGDGFRIPELLESVGARLREVGTTNRVRLEDYAAAIGEQTAFVLKVHPSNFRVEGFTSTVGIAALAELDLPVIADIGSGLLRPHPRLPDEPDAASVLRAGASLVTASGDKLLGGPQCGLMLGEQMLVERLRKHPFARAVRVDKLTLAALEATLRGPRAPVPAALSASDEALRDRAERLAAELGDIASVVRSHGAVGGGGAPGVSLDSWAVALPPQYAEPLRTGDPAVIGRVTAGQLLLDVLAITDDEFELVVDAVRRCQ